jgi:hypothetical protein
VVQILLAILEPTLERIVRAEIRDAGFVWRQSASP